LVQKKRIIIVFAVLNLWIIGFTSVPLLKTTAPTLANSISDVVGRTCHQIPNRSLYIDGSPIAVCARCTAVYIAGWVVLILYFLRGKIRLFPGYLYLLCTAPMILDFILEKMSIYHNLTAVRLITGGLFGLTLFHLMIVSMQSDDDVSLHSRGQAWKIKES